MKKSWFVALVIFLTLLFTGIGIYFFFPTFSTLQTPNTNNIPSFFGNIDDASKGNTPQATTSSSSPISTPENTDETVEQLSGFKALQIGDYQVSSVQPLDFKIGTTSTSTLLLSIGKSGTVRIYDPQTDTTSIVGSLSIPNIIASGFTTNGLYTIVQSQENDTVKTIILKSNPRTLKEERFFSPIFSASNISSFFIEGNTIYMVEKTKSGSEVYMYIPSTGKRTLLYRGVLSDLYGFARKGTVFLGTKAASETRGFIFKLDTNTKTMVKLASGTTLLGIPNQSATSVITTEFFNRNTETNILDVQTRENIFLPLKIVKEKCVPDFSTKTFMFCGVPKTNETNMPDFWYMGKVSTNDDLYLINTENGSFSTLATTNENVDVIFPESSQYSGIITFINKKDSTPWIIVNK